jgi:alpha-amylase
VSNGDTNLLKVRVEGWNGSDKKASLDLDALDFTWNHPVVNQPSNFKNGQKGSIIEMFGWPYDDIADEC